MTPLQPRAKRNILRFLLWTVWTYLTLVYTVKCLKPGVPETVDIRGMEGNSKPETVPPGLGRITSGPLLSDPLEKLHNQTDSVLTAARLARRGWTEDGNKTGWQFSYFDLSAREPSVSRSDGNPGLNPAEICLKEPRSSRVPVVNSRRTVEDREETGSDIKKDEAKRTEAASSADRQAERQTGVYSQTVIRVRVSGCRTTCRQSRRFKAPILPVIAEM